MKKFYFCIWILIWCNVLLSNSTKIYVDRTDRGDEFYTKLGGLNCESYSAVQIVILNTEKCICRIRDKIPGYFYAPTPHQTPLCIYHPACIAIFTDFHYVPNATLISVHDISGDTKTTRKQLVDGWHKNTRFQDKYVSVAGKVFLLKYVGANDTKHCALMHLKGKTTINVEVEEEENRELGTNASIWRATTLTLAAGFLILVVIILTVIYCKRRAKYNTNEQRNDRREVGIPMIENATQDDRGESSNERNEMIDFYAATNGSGDDNYLKILPEENAEYLQPIEQF